MKRHYYLILVLLLTITSCKEKPLTINKLIYLRVYGIVYDSLEKPCLGILPYYEYNKGLETKVAYGVHENGASVAFLNGLDSFYVMETDTKTIELINKTLCNRNYDSTYNVIFDVRCAYFFYETSDKRKRLVVFGKGGDIPYELIDLLQHLEKLWYPTDHLTVTTPFLVDSMVRDFENELFLKYPPGPRQIFKEWSEN